MRYNYLDTLSRDLSHVRLRLSDNTLPMAKRRELERRSSELQDAIRTEHARSTHPRVNDYRTTRQCLEAPTIFTRGNNIHDVDSMVKSKGYGPIGNKKHVKAANKRDAERGGDGAYHLYANVALA